MTLTPEPGTLWLPFRTAARNGAESLRVGLVLDRSSSPPWVDSLRDYLGEIPGIDVLSFTLPARIASRPRNPAWIVDRLYSASQARFDPFGDIANGGTGAGSGSSIDEIRAARCGVMIWLADGQAHEVDLASLAEHGVFTVRLGEFNRPIPFWDEVAMGCATSTATILWHDRTFRQGWVARAAETSTRPGLFITENAEEPLVATIRLIAGLCIEIQRDGPAFESRIRSSAAQEFAGSDYDGYPSNLEAAGFVVRKLARSAYLRWTTRGKQGRWFVARRPNGGRSIAGQETPDLSGFQEVPLPKGVAEMADPFLWETGGKEYLLFEEVAGGQSRGRLGCVEILKNGTYSDMTIFLERPYHLSYPCVISSGSDLFLLPETAEANRLELYRFSRFPWEVELVAAPVEGIALVDTTPVFVENRWYIFTTTIEPFMETVLFSAARLEGPWTLHPSSPVSTSVKSCRSAGQLVWRNGRLYRPTQDCSTRYGYAITVNEVTKLTEHEFEERQVNYVPPAWTPGLLGTHTWNESSGSQVIDGYRYA